MNPEEKVIAKRKRPNNTSENELSEDEEETSTHAQTLRRSERLSIIILIYIEKRKNYSVYSSWELSDGEYDLLDDSV